MADLSSQKPTSGSLDPTAIDAVEAPNTVGQPLLDPQKLLRLHFFGIPPRSGVKDPATGRPRVMTPDDLKEFILEAVSLVEQEVGLDILPRQYVERHPYDRAAQQSFGYMVTRHRPVAAVQSLAVVSSDNVQVWVVPNEWIDVGYAAKGQLGMLPFAISAQSGTTVPLASPNGTGLLPSLFPFPWVPGLWSVTYTTGFRDGLVPVVVNQLVGVVAAMEILSALGPTYSATTSASLSIDGLSQGSSGPGAERFQIRMKELGEKRKRLTRSLQATFGLRLYADNI